MMDVWTFGNYGRRVKMRVFLNKISAVFAFVDGVQMTHHLDLIRAFLRILIFLGIISLSQTALNVCLSFFWVFKKVFLLLTCIKN